MKRELFSTPATLIMSAVILIFTVNSCTKKTSDVEKPALPEEFTTAASSKPGNVSEVRLKMTINDASENNINSDGLGSYVDGSQNVSIYFSTSGNLQFTTTASNNPKIPTVRWFYVNLNSPLSGYISRGILQSGFISTITTQTSPDPTPLQNLPLNTTKCIGFSAAVPDGVINFHRNSYEDIAASQSAYVYMTRISVSPDKWLMTPVPPVSGGCSTISSVAAFRNLATLYGYYNIPFSFLLERKTP